MCSDVENYCLHLYRLIVEMWSKPELELVLASNFGLGVHEIARMCPQPSSEGPNHDAATYIKVGFLYSTSYTVEPEQCALQSRKWQ